MLTCRKDQQHTLRGLLTEAHSLEALSSTAGEGSQTTRTKVRKAKATTLHANSNGKTRKKSKPPNHSCNERQKDPDQASSKPTPGWAWEDGNARGKLQRTLKQGGSAHCQEGRIKW